eukprot:m.74875 g.74875  ORF g.74875 m.74875 type:complete len:160 (-) comp11824_c0_seq1:1654-2133(-)
MEFIVSVYGLLFKVLRPPNLQSSRKGGNFSSLHEMMPSKGAIFILILASYFLITGGVIYDVINEPPSLGYEVAPNGRTRSVPFMVGRINGQYIIEGLSSSMMFVLGGLGLIALLKGNELSGSGVKGTRISYLVGGGLLVFIAYTSVFFFMKSKLPGYLN